MKPLAAQTPKPNSNRSRSKETPQSKRSETGSNDPKVNFEDLRSSSPASSSAKSRQPKTVSKTLDLEFDAVSSDLPASALDPPLFLPDPESSSEDQESASSIPPRSAISSEEIQGGAGSGKTAVSVVESREAAMLIDLMKESILELKTSTTQLLETLNAGDLGGEARISNGWNDPRILMTLLVGLCLLLILTVGVPTFLIARAISALRGQEWDFTGLPPT